MLTLSMKKSFCNKERQKRRASRGSRGSVGRGGGSSSLGSQLHAGDAESSQQISVPSEPCPYLHPDGERGLHACPNHHITPDGDKTQGQGRKVTPSIRSKTGEHEEQGRRGLGRKQAVVEHSWSGALRPSAIFLGVVSSAWRAGRRRSAVTHPHTTVSLFRQYI